MKKVYLISISIFLIVCNIQAQDLIVTNSGDSINCNITKVTKSYVYFIFQQKSTAMPANLVATHQKGYFVDPSTSTAPPVIEDFPRFRVAVDAGGQMRTAKLVEIEDVELRKHAQKLRMGLHYDLQAAYFFTETIGIEAMFSQQLFWNTLGNGVLTDANEEIIGSGKFKESTRLNYIGANYLVRLFDSQKKNSWLFAFGLGYMNHNNRLLFNKVEGERNTANTLGVNMSIGYDLESSENISLGFKLSLMGGSYRNYKHTAERVTTNETIPDNMAEGLGTIKLSIGLRFNK